MPARAKPSEPTIPALRIPAPDAKAKLAERVAAGEALLKDWEASRGRPNDDEYQRQKASWDDYNKSLLTSIFEGTLFLDQYKKQTMSMGILDVRSDPDALLRS